MSTIQNFRILHTDNTDASTVQLTEVFEFDIEEGLNANMDSFQFRVLLDVGQKRSFDLDDGIKIYIDDGTAEPTTLIHDGIITELFYEIDVQGISVTVRGVNRVERMLFSPAVALYATDFSHTGARDSQTRTGWGAVITHLIDRANEFKSDQDDTVITYDITSVPDLGQLENEFNFDWNSIYELINIISSAEWTPDGNDYILELDTTNKLHMRNTSSADYTNSQGTIDLDGINVISSKVSYGIFDVINAIILNCGKDTNGNSILVTFYDSSSMNRYGAKYKYIKKET